jgi:hypothetical protein
VLAVGTPAERLEELEARLRDAQATVAMFVYRLMYYHLPVDAVVAAVGIAVDDCELDDDGLAQVARDLTTRLLDLRDDWSPGP